jgi:phage gpG-like protein
MAGVQLRGGADLSKLGRALQLVRSSDFKRGLFKQLSVEALVQVVLSFDREQDPYDRKWAPIRNPGKRRRGGKVLSDTGRLRNSFRASASDRTFVVNSKVAYAAIHNYGGTLKRRAQPVNADTGRFIRRTQAATRLRQNQLQGRRAAVALRFLGEGAIPARPFLPQPGRLGKRWTEAFTDISDAYLARALNKRPPPGGR